MAKEKIASNAQFSGTGKGLVYVKDFCYAYSGAITVSGTDDVALDFSTGKHVIDAKLMIQYLQASSDGDDAYVTVELNGEDVIGSLVGANHGGAQPDFSPNNWIPIIIPPLSRVRVLFTMLSGGGSIVLGSNVTGRVYE
jgi:hypothetical protein|tara:strand:+ start:368 stop:784 length:417 start_codon:yes stop_codon:yes gene_type:complete